MIPGPRKLSKWNLIKIRNQQILNILKDQNYFFFIQLNSYWEQFHRGQSRYWGWSDEPEDRMESLVEADNEQWKYVQAGNALLGDARWEGSQTREGSGVTAVITDRLPEGMALEL